MGIHEYACGGVYTYMQIYVLRPSLRRHSQLRPVGIKLERVWKPRGSGLLGSGLMKDCLDVRSFSSPKQEGSTLYLRPEEGIQNKRTSPMEFQLCGSLTSGCLKIKGLDLTWAT